MTMIRGNRAGTAILHD